MELLELLQFTFFQHALLGSLLASIACGLIGTYIVTRRLVPILLLSHIINRTLNQGIKIT